MMLFFLLLCVIGCDSYTPNQPLEKASLERNHSFDSVLRENEDIGENFVVLSLSGGGIRAAALAYGVMKHLGHIKLQNGQGTLIDEINVISSVSAGSFAAAYFGLYGRDRFLAEFPAKVLYNPIQRHLEKRLLNPYNWVRLMSPTFGRSELAQEIYVEQIFGNRTFRDLQPKWPFIIINATDLTRGTQFAFTQDYFDLLSSDLASFPIARAVAASSACPGWLSPVTLSNYPHPEHGQETTPWVEEALSAYPEIDLVIHNWAKAWKSYEDEEKRPYVHLIDGAVADNLGTLQPSFAMLTHAWSLLRKVAQTESVKRVIVIVVDAQTKQNHGYDRSPDVPGIWTTFWTAVSEPVLNYSSDTVAIVHLLFEEFRRAKSNFETLKTVCEELAQMRSAGNRGSVETEIRQCLSNFKAPYGHRPLYPDFHLIHISFDFLKDPVLRRRLDALPTLLELPAEAVDLIVESAATLIDQSADFQRLIDEMRAAN